MNHVRKPEYHIRPEFTERWSPRAFTREEISHEVLNRGFEAARWAPSGGNSQPARFLFARRGSPVFATMVDILAEGNRGWAKEAAVLLVLLGRKDFEMNGKRIESSSVSFDVGAAWMSFALQLAGDGWATHAMAGFDRDQVRQRFDVPANYTVEVMIAAGRRGDKDILPEAVRAREFPSARHPTQTFYAEDAWPAAWRE